MKTGGHIKRCNVGSVEDHNERRQEYLDRLEAAGHPLHYFPELTKNNQHWVNEDKHYKGKTAAEIFKLQQLWYFKLKHQKPQLKDREYTDKNGRVKVKAGWSPLREAVIVIKPDTKLSDFDPVLAWFRSKGVTPFRLDIHLDEGHVSKKSNKRHINYHAHLGLDWMNWKNGSTVKLGKKDMSELQTVLAKALGMERGILKEITGKEHIDQDNYRAFQQADENREIAEENLQLKQERDALKLEIEQMRKLSQELQVKNTFEGAAVAVGQAVAGVFGQSRKDKTIEQLQATVAGEPGRTAAVIKEWKDKYQVQCNLNRSKSDKIKEQQDTIRRQANAIEGLNVKMSDLTKENNSLKSKLSVMDKIEKAMKDCCDWAAKCARGTAVWDWVYEKFETLCNAKGINNEWKNGRHSAAADVWLEVVDPDNQGHNYGKFTEQQQQKLDEELHKAADHPELGQGKGMKR